MSAVPKLQLQLIRLRSVPGIAQLRDANQILTVAVDTIPWLAAPRSSARTGLALRVRGTS